MKKKVSFSIDEVSKECYMLLLDEFKKKYDNKKKLVIVDVDKIMINGIIEVRSKKNGN